MKARYDAIVVGAGPAGSTAARLAAERGLDVLLIEKRREIGSPVRCAEAAGLDSLQPYIEPDERWINARVSRFAVHDAAGHSFRVPPTGPTLVIERKIFDRELAARAVQAGATVMAGAAAVGLLREDGRIAGVKVRRGKDVRDVGAALVFAADGTESQVARWAGLNSRPAPADYYVAAEYLLCTGSLRFDPSECQYHVGASIAPGGYAWVFPKGERMANVGLVLSADRAASRSAMSYLEQFVAKRFGEAGILSEIAGGIPVTGALKHLVTDGLMVIGDAAHQADPLHGGGINLGMIAADLAVQVGAPATARGDVSAKTLRAYEAVWQKRFGRQHDSLYRIRKILAAVREESLNDLIATASQLPLADMTLGQILLAVLKDQPSLLLQARGLIAGGLIGK
ncbi:MAG: NAD(P)/FAD-dependent oxidoreductase [Anaerolineales bacterium]|nr:NAD(P)/FAD-dependent oxidoreductase [Anaerolineales bacterium]